MNGWWRGDDASHSRGGGAVFSPGLFLLLRDARECAGCVVSGLLEWMTRFGFWNRRVLDSNQLDSTALSWSLASATIRYPLNRPHTLSVELRFGRHLSFFSAGWLVIPGGRKVDQCNH